MRLRLDIEYDGTDFARVGRAARLPDGRGRRCARRSAGCSRGRTGSPSRGGPTRASTPSARSSSVDVTGGPPPGRAAEALNSALPDDVAVLAADRRRRASTRASRRGRGRTATGSGAAATPSPVRAAPQLVVAAPIDEATARRRGRRCSSASTTSARSRRPRPSTRSSCAMSSGRAWHARRRARARDHRRQLPAPHGPDARRDDARAGAVTSSPSCSRARRARRPATTAPPWGPVPRSASQLLTAATNAASIGRMRFPVVLFDLDGTLVDSGWMILASDPARDDDACSAATSPTRCCWPTSAGRRPRGADARRSTRAGRRAVEAYRAHNAPLHDELEAFPGMLELLEKLDDEGRPARHRHARSAATPSSSRPTRSPLGDGFDVVVGVGRDASAQALPGPDPRRARAARRRARTTRRTSATRRSTSRRRRRPACYAVAVTWGGIHTRATETEGPDAVVDTAEELLGVL